VNKKILNTAILTAIIGLVLFSLTASVAGAQWVVQINGAVDNPFSFTLADLAVMPQTDVSAALLCDGAYVTSGIWTGVKLSYLLEQAEFHQNASSIVFHAQDGYTSNIPIGAIQNDDVIVAHALDGEPLKETLRLVLPNANGEFWIAWLTSITVSMDPYTPPQQQMIPPPPPLPPKTPPKQTPTMPTPPTPSQNQTTTQPVTPPTDSQPLQSSSSSVIPAEYGVPVILAAIAVTPTAIGYIAYDRRKNTNKTADSNSHQSQL
jgi:DMSO/TMAO reductase YedYZ molybdopterin-dependent catalytic subunit